MRFSSFRTKTLLTFLLIFPFLSYISFSLMVSEVMFNPAQNDNYNEYVEIYNDGNNPVNLSSYLLCNNSIIPGYVERANNTSLLVNSSYSTALPPGGFALITDGGSGSEVASSFNITNLTFVFHVNSSSICGGLKNDGGNVTLKNADGSVISFLSYNKSFNREGLSVQVCNDKIILADPTPLKANLCNTSNVTEGQRKSTYSIELKIENLSCLVCDADTTLTYRICAYLNASPIRTVNLTVEYSIENLYGDVMKSPHNTTIEIGKGRQKGCTTTRRWTPSRKVGYEVFFINARIVASSVNLTNLTYNRTMVVVKSKVGSSNNGCVKPTVKIENVNAKNVKFGDVLRVKLVANRGCESKRTVYVYIKSASSNRYASEKLSIQLYKKNQNYTIYLPVQIRYNCNRRLRGGKYFVVAESSWGSKDEWLITIKDGASPRCIKEVVTKTSTCSVLRTRAKEKATLPNRCLFADILNVSHSPAAVGGGDLTTRISLKSHNPANRINISIYSYIICEGKLFSKGGWLANRQDLVLLPNETKVIVLKNKIKEINITKTCTLRIRLSKDKKKCDVDSKVVILPAPHTQICDCNTTALPLLSAPQNEGWEHKNAGRSSHNRSGEVVTSHIIYDYTPLGRIRMLINSLKSKIALIFS